MRDWRPEILTRLSGLKLTPAREAEIVEELSQHLDDRYDELLADRMSEADARRLVLDELADHELLRNEMRPLTQAPVPVPIVAGGPRGHLLGDLWQDVRYSLRTLRRSPAFAAVAVLVLALGIGVNTAVFSIVNAVFFRPPAVQAPNKLVYLYSVNQSHQIHVTDLRDVEFYTKHTEAFAAVTAHWRISLPFSADHQTDRIFGELVAANYFVVLGVKPAIGRTFRAEEDDVATTDLAVVISHEWWMRRFDGDARVLGKRVRIDDKSYTVVGVMGPGFVGLTDPWTPSRYWITSVQILGGDGRRVGFGVIGRLRPGVSLAQARAIVAVQSRQMWREWMEQVPGPTVSPTWQPDPYLVLPISDVRTPFDPSAKVVSVRLASAVAVVVVIVLFIAAANIAGILMARGVTRTSEFAIRRALGAGALRLIRQLLTESIIVSIAGGLVGLLLALTLVRLYHTYTPMRFIVDVPLDIRVLLFTVAVCVGVGVVVGLAPALQVMKVDIIAALGGGAGTTTRVRRRLRHGIVIPQVALALVLLIVAGVHVHALAHIEQTDLGYGVDDRVVLNVDHWDPSPARRFVRPTQDEVAKQAERSRTFYRQVFDSIRNVPGAVSMVVTDRLPVYSGEGTTPFVSQDAFLSGSGERNIASQAGVSSGYFRTMGMSLRGGRDFDDRDSLTSVPVAIVSEGLAKRLWPKGDAIGKSIAASIPGKADQKLEWLEVVGVVNEVDPILHDRGQFPFVYVPLAQLWWVYGARVVAWERGDPSQLIKQFTHAVTGADPFAEVTSVQTMKQVVGEILYPRRAAASILLVCGLVGLLLASIGLYGVMSYSVAQRLREIGIRSTLGAARKDIVTLVLREGATVAAIGAVPGLGLSVLALRLTSSLVGAVPTHDVVTFIAIPVVVAIVILAACYIPARHAARVDPMVVLRGL